MSFWWNTTEQLLCRASPSWNQQRDNFWQRLNRIHSKWSTVLSQELWRTCRERTLSLVKVSWGVFSCPWGLNFSQLFFLACFSYIIKQLRKLYMYFFLYPQDGSRVSGICGGYCGKCTPSSSPGLLVEVSWCRCTGQVCRQTSMKVYDLFLNTYFYCQT